MNSEIIISGKENIENKKPILIVSHIGISTSEHIAHILAQHGLRENDVEIITLQDAKEGGILIDRIDIPKIEDVLKNQVFELKAHPFNEMPIYINPGHKRECIPTNHKRTNKKKKRR